MSSKATSQRRKARLALAEARAHDLRAILERIITVIETAEGAAFGEEWVSAEEVAAPRALELARNAIAQDDQRLAPEAIRRAVHEAREALKDV